MKAEQFYRSLSPSIGIADAVENADVANAWRQFLSVFASAPKRNVADVLKLLESVSAVSTEGGVPVASFERIRVLLGDLLQVTAKKAVVDDWGRLSEFIERNPHLSAEASIGAVQGERSSEATVEKYIDGFKSSIDDPSKFFELLQKLREDRNLSAADVKAIARAVAGKPGRSKQNAIDNIELRLKKKLGSSRRREAARHGSAG